MNLNCQNILKMTEAQLRYKSDVSLQEATPQELHEALSQAVMMSISENWTKSKRSRIQGRKAHYFSAEYLIGRLVYSNLYNLGILDELKKTFLEVGVDLACMEDIEDAALGNGGLGRLAACFLDSAATCNLPLSGYGLRYRFGLFKQKFDDNGSQKETADDWTKFGDPWSYRRYNHTVKIRFPDHTVLAVPYDVPIIGYETSNIPMVIWKNSAHPEICEAFIKYLYEPENYVPFLLSVPVGMLPALKEIADNEQFLSDPMVQKFSHAKDVISKAVGEGTAIGMENGPRPEAGLLTSQGVIESMFQDIVINGTPVEQAAKAAEDKLNDLFETVG